MDMIYGRNAVLERLKSGKQVEKIFIQQGNTSADKVVLLAKEMKIGYIFVNKKKLDVITQRANHQGIVAYVPVYQYVGLDDILKKAADKNEQPFLVIAENLTDPNNLGNIIRSANAGGVHGVIIPKNRSVGLSSAVAKVSCGAVEHTAVAKVTNISVTIDQLKKRNIWILGTYLEADEYYFNVDLTGAIAIVIGSENKGISRLVREKCDVLAKIPMLGKIQSLNASVSAGIIVCEAVRQKFLKQIV